MTWSVIHGNSLAPDALPSIEDRSFAHVITDPPYSDRVHNRLGKEGRKDGYQSRADLAFDCLSEAEAFAQAEQWCRTARRWILVFCDELSFGLWVEAIEAAGGQYVRKGTWVKSDPMPQMSGDRPATGTEEILIAHAPRESGRLRWNGGGRPAVYHARPRENAIERIHPTQKPLALMEPLLRDFTDRDEIILDPYAGSGSTLVAARRLGRFAIGYERRKEYARAAQRRIDAVREQRELFAMEAV